MEISGQTIGELTLPGILVHELAHYLVCVLFRLRVHSFAYYPDQKTLGHVSFIPSRSPFVNLAVGISPLLLNSATSALVLAPVWYLMIHYGFRLWHLPLIYFGLCVGFHAAPSNADLKVALVNESSIGWLKKTLVLNPLTFLLAHLNRPEGALGVFVTALAIVGAYFLASLPAGALLSLYLAAGLCAVYMLYRVARHQDVPLVVLSLRLLCPFVEWLWLCLLLCVAAGAAVYLAFVATSLTNYAAVQMGLQRYPSAVIAVLTVILFVPVVFALYGLHILFLGAHRWLQAAVSTLMTRIEAGRSGRQIIRCALCGQRLRVPICPATIRVTCPSCKGRFCHDHRGA